MGRNPSKKFQRNLPKEQPKQQEKPAQIDMEDIRKHILNEVHRWLVTSESPHQLIVRIKTMELPEGADDQRA